MPAVRIKREDAKDAVSMRKRPGARSVHAASRTAIKLALVVKSFPIRCNAENSTTLFRKFLPQFSDQTVQVVSVRSRKKV